jgi:hypothetical protein
VIEGDGKGVTIIAIPSSFNLSAQGVFVCPGGPWVPGPQFRDFQINFAQPDTTDNSALTHYPAAFYCQSVARATWHRIKINAAMVGIDLRLNAAGASIVDCELCCFDWHIYLDGEADSITVQSCRFEPDLLTANQTTIYHGAARGILSGRCDDLHVIGCLFFCAIGIQLIVSADGTSSTIGNVTNCDFDTYAGINIAAGNLEVSGCDFTMGASTGYAVEMAGGNLSMSACWFLATVTLAGGMIQTSASVGITLQISASRFDMAASTNHSAVASFTNGIVILNGCHFNMPQTTRTLAAVSITDAVLLTMNGCRFTPKGAASGAALSVSLDGAHNVCGNVFGGWAASIPGTTRVFANNVA